MIIFYYVYDILMFKISKVMDLCLMLLNCFCGKFKYEFILVIVYSDIVNDNDCSIYLFWYYYEVR